MFDYKYTCFGVNVRVKVKGEICDNVMVTLSKVKFAVGYMCDSECAVRVSDATERNICSTIGR